MVSLSGISSGFLSASPSASVRQGATGNARSTASGGGKELTQEQQTQVRELQKTDAQVKAHEQAHKAAGGPYAGGIQYEYTTGPDGRRYATGGEVPIDTAPVRGNPEATIAKMEVVKRAALSPQDPSPQDRAVAAKADAAKAQAQNERNSGESQDSADATANLATAGNDPAQSAGADLALFRQATKNYGRASTIARPGLSLIA